MQLESNPNLESSSRSLAPLGLVEDHALVGHQRLVQLRPVPESLCIAQRRCQAPYLWHCVYPQWLSEHNGPALPISILGLLPDNLGLRHQDALEYPIVPPWLSCCICDQQPPAGLYMECLVEVLTASCQLIGLKFCFCDAWRLNVQNIPLRHIV